MSPQPTRLCVALDTTKRSDFLKLFESLSDLPLVFKVGLRMFPLLEKSDWKLFSGKSLFVDAKLHDIPTQVADTVKAYGDLGASFLTLHLSGGRKMLELAAQCAAPYKMKLLGVSVLTSLNDSDLLEMGWSKTQQEENLTQKTVLNLASLGMSSGIDSFVCSAFEIQSILKKFPHAYLATPGLTLNSALHSDQNRSTTLKEALLWGTKMGILGRAIINDTNPRSRAEEALRFLAP